ncbi:hypothetical protein SAMN05216345_102693 [Cupriavidus sp. YR651]|uniref:hypothetical protein n=1 Tax=Cupriavidus sp. YR651 TaxID=1855315 RepID=UPI00087F90A4|nr:hypothetical protein [Cupriavidus sp. YR651]SDC54283.1 hypothetical protein SAMN05216345_102693 [Cupriavidus sp. YR651]
MFSTPYGPFDGNSWERLCQLVFKRKFAEDGYLNIPATPGDYGLEGFTKSTGCGYQCYCPDKAYPTKDLHDKQRDKITTDLKKLRTNEADLKKLLGPTKLRRWYLVTPVIAHNELLKHAQTKEAEVRGWSLSILEPDFQVLVHDGDHYAAEIQEMMAATGQSMNFGGLPVTLPHVDVGAAIYHENVARKTRARFEGRYPPEKVDSLTEKFAKITLKEFLEHDAHFRRINEEAPAVHSRLAKLINGYEADVVEACATWEGTPQELTEKIRDGLTDRITKELAPAIDGTEAALIARLMVSRWIAVCEVDYG